MALASRLAASIKSDITVRQNNLRETFAIGFSVPWPEKGVLGVNQLTVDIYSQCDRQKTVACEPKVVQLDCRFLAVGE
jgi:hypothetical protein